MRAIGKELRRDAGVWNNFRRHEKRNRPPRVLAGTSVTPPDSATVAGRFPFPDMKPAPAFQFYPDDFVSGTFHLTDEEVGQYIRCLCHQWNVGGLSSDRLSGATKSGTVSPRILEKFKVGTDGLYRNRRLEEERRKQKAFRDNKKQAGQEGAKRRWHTHPSAIGTPIVLPIANDSSPSPSPSPSPISRSSEGGAPPFYEQVASFIEELGFTLFNRVEGQRPSNDEERAAVKILKRPTWQAEKDSLLVFSRMCKPEDRRFEFPKSLIRLLENWNEFLDKARNYKPHEKHANANRPGADRNENTANARRIGQYDGIGKVGRVP